MSRTLFTGAAGLAANQYYINNIGANIANINTTGYKPVVTSFSDLLYSKMYVKSADVLSGQGSRASYGGINPSQSSLVPTGESLDLALNGDGWFAVDTKNGVRYTRSGAFTISAEGNTSYLVDENGDYVLDKNGNHIAALSSTATVPENAETGTDAQDAAAEKKTGFDPASLTAQVGVFRFANPEALTPNSSNLYEANAQSGAASVIEKPDVVTGYLEQSGMSMVDGMVDLVAAQRAYQLSAKVLQTADEDEQTVNSLRS